MCGSASAAAVRAHPYGESNSGTWQSAHAPGRAVTFEDAISRAAAEEGSGDPGKLTLLGPAKLLGDDPDEAM